MNKSYHKGDESMAVLLIILAIAVIILVLTSCADTRHMAKYYNKMETGQPSDTVYQAKGNIYIIK